MFSSILDYIEEIKEQLSPIQAHAQDEDEEDEEEEEEDEPVDQLDKLRAECKATEKGQGLVHHYMECVERVKKGQELPNYDDLDYKENCVEEFFHLQHYLDQCASPRLFDQLK